MVICCLVRADSGIAIEFQAAAGVLTFPSRILATAGAPPEPTLKKMTALMTATSALPMRLPVTLPPRPPPCPRVTRLRLQPGRRALLRCTAVSELAPAASAAYGVLLLGGGAFAYARSGSKGSIYGGLAGSALMGIAYYLMQSPETKAAGDAVGFGSAFLFACVFGIRLYNSRKLVPSGLLLALSLGALGVFYSAYLQDKI